ncbi:MAG: hypothetical protein WKG07_44750 [Hymenobacter sp.]
MNGTAGKWAYSYGVMGQYIQYDNRFFNRLRRAVFDGQGNLAVSPTWTCAFRRRLISGASGRSGSSPARSWTATG